MKLNVKRTVGKVQEASRESRKALKRNQGCLFLWDYGKNEWEKEQIRRILENDIKVNIETIQGRTYLMWIKSINREIKLAQIELK